MIESIQLYCIGDAVDEITLRYSPHPCLGPVGEVVITPAAAWAWQPFVIEEMWNYDSLFIWVYECEANVDWAYDAVQPYDGHETSDVGATWADMAIRPFIRAVITGETPGDVPVSGVVNTVEIPSIGSAASSVAPINVPNNAITTLLTMEGAGTMLEAAVTLDTAVPPTAGALPGAVMYLMYLLADGQYTLNTNNRQLTQSCVATSGRCSMGEFFQCSVEDPPFATTYMFMRAPVKFRRSLTLRVIQTSGAAVNVAAGLWANLMR